MEGKRREGLIPAGQRLIYALDGMRLEQALQAVRELRNEIGIYKIGPSLVYQGGLDAAKRIVDAGKGEVRVFLDMKTWDIPETVLKTIEQINTVGPEVVAFATFHTFALDFRKLEQIDSIRNFKMFAITLLTSQDAADLAELRIEMGVEDYVLLMARRARDFGCDGVICSGLEARRIKAEIGGDFSTIVPGVRPSGFQVDGDDQKRVVTPREAILNGADYLVVGRPIRNAPDPVRAARGIQAEIAAALAEAGASSEKPPDGGPNLMAAR